MTISIRNRRFVVYGMREIGAFWCVLGYARKPLLEWWQGKLAFKGAYPRRVMGKSSSDRGWHGVCCLNIRLMIKKGW
jgi:hypothetical protein